MRAEPFWFRASDSTPLHAERWLPDAEPRAWLQIVHGMGEHAGRYAHLAGRLCEAGLAVLAHDQRGHGRTARESPLGDLGPGGWSAAVRDVNELARLLREESPGIPHVLLGHSMGALVAQASLPTRPPGLAGCALSGTPFMPLALARIAALLAWIEIRRLGPEAQSPLLRQLVFGRAERSVRPARTAFDWLSRDPAVVDAYCDDPHCGFVASTRSLHELFMALPRLARVGERLRESRALPIHFLAGGDDPIAGPHAVARWVGCYQRAGFLRVSQQIYPGARHEPLNESNREAVERDLLNWISRSLGAPDQ